MRATFVFQNARASLLAGLARGVEPDSTLLGANHFGDLGIDATVHDALLTRRAFRHPLDWAAWNLREVTLPFELGRTDVLFTPLANVVPLAAAARRLPVVVINYGLNLILRRAGRNRRRLLAASLRRAARVVCLGESQRQELMSLVGVASDRTLTLLLPIDERFFAAPGGESVPADTVVSVGKDLARDYGTLMTAVDGLDARVEVAADPRNLSGLRIPSNVSTGLRPSVEIRDLYATAACVVLPQRPDDYPYGSEGGGLTALLEAMSMGKPVVATNRAILADYIDDGVDGILVPPSDPQAMRAAIERVLGDQRLAAQLGAAGRARVERAHTTRGFARQVAPVLRSVV